MASHVCDRTPCEYMQAAIDSLVTSSYRNDRFSIRVQAQADARISFLVALKYCPFCGTRLDPQWAKNFYQEEDPSSGPLYESRVRGVPDRRAKKERSR
jgi:hypothetical protein